MALRTESTSDNTRLIIYSTIWFGTVAWALIGLCIGTHQPVPDPLWLAAGGAAAAGPAMLASLRGTSANEPAQDVRVVNTPPEAVPVDAT